MRLTRSWTLLLLAIALPIAVLWGIGNLVAAFVAGWGALFLVIWLMLWAACAFLAFILLALAAARPRSVLMGAAQRSLLFVLGVGCVVPTVVAWGWLLSKAFESPQSPSGEVVGTQIFLAPVTLTSAVGVWILYRLWRDFRRPLW